MGQLVIKRPVCNEPRATLLRLECGSTFPRGEFLSHRLRHYEQSALVSLADYPLAGAGGMREFN